MNPQGTAPINTSYYTAMTTRVNAAKSCGELQALAKQLMDSLNAESGALTAQLAFLQPLEALLSAPTDLPKLLTWVSTFINTVLRPMYAPYLTLVAQLPLREAAVAELLAAIAAKAASFDSCTVTPPEPVAPTIPG